MKDEPTSEILFNQTGDFMAYWAAEHWIKENGYSCGSMCSPMPTAILKGDVHIAKWKNLTAQERNSVDGIIIADSFRDGPCKILLYNSQNKMKDSKPVTEGKIAEFSIDQCRPRQAWDSHDMIDFANQYAKAKCGICGNFLTLVRPGKYQCDHCESQPTLQAVLDYAIKMGDTIVKYCNERKDGNAALIFEHKVDELKKLSEVTLPEKAEQWISVEDQKPPICDKVIVNLSDGCVLVGRLYSNGWCAFFMDGEKEVIERQVTHWQPLPEPHKVTRKE